MPATTRAGEEATDDDIATAAAGALDAAVVQTAYMPSLI
jgi:hypothetical protein